jgi:hypothetical protein
MNTKQINNYSKYKENTTTTTNNTTTITNIQLQQITEISTRNLPRGKKRPARKADKLTAICEPIV